MSNRYELTAANNQLLSALAKRNKCNLNSPPNVQRTAALYARLTAAVDELTREVLAEHAATGCQHAQTLRAQLETPTSDPDQQP